MPADLIATYRLQLSEVFDLHAAASLAGYLRWPDVSYVYAFCRA